MNTYDPAKLHRLLIKVSGEFLAGEQGFGFQKSILDQLTDDIIDVSKLGYEIGIVIGGGNICRGKQLAHIEQAAADNVGMLATVQNAVVLTEVFKQKNYPAEVFNAFPIPKISRYFTYQEADRSLKDGNICFFAGGTGNPFFTTDTAAVLRAIELNCDIVLKGTKVDGIYTADPKKFKEAEFIKEISYSEALARQLNVMDMTAFSLARDYKMPIKVFNITESGNLKNAILSANIGTFVGDI
jgi:uridylate kinase